MQNNDLNDYEKPSLTTDMVLFRVNRAVSENKRKVGKLTLEILLVEREEDTQKGFLALPGGFVSKGTKLKDNVKIKLEQKTGHTGNFYIEQLYTKDSTKDGQDRDPRGWVVTVAYLGLCNPETIVNKGSILTRGWYPVDKVLTGDYGDLAFDHAEIIADALERLKNKVDYTDIVFNLLPTEFTISDLQTVYEILLQKEINNFRRKIGDYVIPLNKKTEGSQFRPAELFALNKNRNSVF